jgi:hypothetical protein
VVATQGRALWILDNLSSLHQITPQTTTTQPVLFKPRDGYRTRTGAAIVGPTIEYVLPSVPESVVTIDILDAAGATVNSYNSNAPAAGAGGGGRGGRGGGGGAGAGAAQQPPDPDAPMMEGRTGRGGGAPAPRVTKLQGRNRFVWNVQHSSGLGAPPGQYQARLTVGESKLTQPFTVLIDPRLAAEGITAADLKLQFDHNTRMRAFVAEVNEFASRVRDAQAKAKSSGDAGSIQRADAIAGKLFTEPVRYGKPGLQAHVSYLAGMTTGVDQKVGKDALDRYAVLRKEFDALKTQLK